MAKAAAKGPNAVAEVMERLGGGTKAAKIADVRVATIYAWRDAGKVLHLAAAVRLADACERSPAAWRLLVRRLAGLAD